MKKIFDVGFASGEICQLGFTTPDIEGAMAFYAKQLGVGPWNYMKEFASLGEIYRGSPDTSKKSIAMAYTGSVFIELIQQRSDGMSVYKEHFSKHGFGLHHYGCFVSQEDVEAKIASLVSIGFAVIFEALTPTGSRVRYLGPGDADRSSELVSRVGIGYIEVIELIPADEAMFLRLKAEAASWDGAGVYCST